jgi:hypothetical protein
MGWVSSSSGLVAGVPRSTVCPGKADSAFDSPHNMYTVYVAMDDSVNDLLLPRHRKLPLPVSYLTERFQSPSRPIGTPSLQPRCHGQ